MSGLPEFVLRPEPLPEMADLLAQDAPSITLDMAAELARDLYGISGSITPLSAEKDANFRIRLDTGAQALLKVTNTAEDRGVTDMQTAALIHLAHVDPDLPVQRICRSVMGRSAEIITGPNGDPHIVRLMSFLSGTILAGASPTPEFYPALGSFMARVTRGLRGFFHPAAGHILQWDIKQAHRLRPMLDVIGDAAMRARVAEIVARFDSHIAPQLSGLRAQVVHNDFNPHNLLADGERASRPVGLIDFGDMVHTPIACDLAVACSYQVTEGDRPLDRIAQILSGYASVLPLEPEELELLPDLMRLRYATTLIVAERRARAYPANADYILRNTRVSLNGLDALDRVGTSAAQDILCAAAMERPTR
ncbi:phosphotransferase [Roseovarius nanhaiticus]|uniref:phosphotransferase n=1 Tax=Roseovarius nanhaiticus TaxID=573024 RepID=UPI0024903DF1|nr:phosphotransferase [Roseovarius nanhaiticus]